MISQQGQMESDVIVSKETAPRFDWGNNCEGWWLKKQGNFTVISEIMPKGSTEIQHFHQSVEQFFYVLEGILSIELDGVAYDLKQHEGITVMPEIGHKVFNRFYQLARFLVISCPNSHEDRVELEKPEV